MSTNLAFIISAVALACLSVMWNHVALREAQNCVAPYSLSGYADRKWRPFHN